MPREKHAPQENVRALIDQAESFATALVLISFGLCDDTLPQEQAGAIAANANEILGRLNEIRSALLK
jgi:hypothetical protein